MDIQSVKRKGKVKEAQIESKDQRWHCRNRVSLVFGSNGVEELTTHLFRQNKVEFATVNFHQAKSKAIEEIIDNSIDEFYRGHVTEIHVMLSSDKKIITVADNGIGFPLEKIKDVYTEFRTGSKFNDEDTDKDGFLFRTLGQNGVGASATCYTSDRFRVTVRHYNTGLEQTYEFIDGALEVKKTKPKSFKGASGVEVVFTLAKEVYKDNTVDEDLLRKRIIDLAYNNPGLIFFFNKEKILFKKGLVELAERISADAINLGDAEYIFEGESAKGKKIKAKINLSVSLAYDKESEERERFVSFVNSTPTFDGGFHHDKIKRSFVNSIKEKLERATKKEDIHLTDFDVMAGTTFIIGIVMPNPRFESQTKRKLVKDTYLEKAIDQFMLESMEKFLKKQKEYLELIHERARQRQKFQDLKEASLKGKKQKKIRVEKLLDANERKNRQLCTLFICEGDSAIGGLRSARDKLYQGGIALRGKPLNVSQASIKDVLENQELSDVMASVGLTIGKRAEEQDLRYSKIVFLADSDVDGGHINTLLTNFFFTYWPELFVCGMIQVAKSPLYEIITDQGKIYAETYEELEKIRNSGKKIKEIQRNKGLGEMSSEAFRELLQRKDFTKITVDDMKKAKDILQVCFGKETGPRKDLLMDQEIKKEIN